MVGYPKGISMSVAPEYLSDFEESGMDSIVSARYALFVSSI